MYISFSEDELKEVARKVIKESPSKFLCFHGPMGSGKTTLIKALVQELGAQDVALSPTFGIVNEYHHKNGELLGFHFDFYRLEDAHEALDLGLEHYFGQDVWIFMEWPEKIASLLPHDRTKIQLRVIDTKTRNLIMTPA